MIIIKALCSNLSWKEVPLVK